MILTIQFWFINLSIISCQSYIPAVQEGNTWIEYASEDDFMTIDYWAFRIEGDTMVNDNIYKKVYQYDLQSNQTDPFVVEDKNFAGFIFEDTLARKVWGNCILCGKIENSTCMDTLLTSPLPMVLLMDFNVSIGDSYNSCFLEIIDNFDHPITSDSISFLFGKNRRIITDSCGLNLIEGVGYDDGLFNSAHCWIHAGHGYGLVTFCEGSDSLNCDLFSSYNSPEPESVSLNVYPNPATESIIVESSWEIDRIEMYSMDGRLMLTTSDSILNCSELDEGLYIIRIVDDRGRSSNYKIVVANR